MMEESHRRPSTLWLYYLVLLFICGVAYISYYKTSDFLKPKRMFTHYNDQTLASGIKTLLFWTKHYSRRDYGFGLGRKPFLAAGCHVTSCRTTTDRSEFDSADAVVFSIFNKYVSSANFRLPVRAHPGQIYVMVVFESPLRMYYDIGKFRDQFNLTVSYLRHPETDIIVPAGKVIPKEGTINFTSVMEKKTKMVAWVVSNCKARSQRMNYARELGRYVPVDIYGACGNLSCPRRSEDCFRYIGGKYKFYLAFENSYCMDYVTEKLYRTLRYDIVPVTLGRVNYSSLLPTHAHIDIRDFSSPRDLANYLVWLDKHDDQYLSYLTWKSHFRSLSRRNIGLSPAMCGLCDVIHRDSYQYKTNFRPETYWSSQRWCLRGEAERRELHFSEPS